MLVVYLSYDSFSGLVVFEEEVVSLNEKLTGVFISLGHPPLSKQNRTVSIRLSVELLLLEANTKGAGMHNVRQNTRNHMNHSATQSVNKSCE